MIKALVQVNFAGACYESILVATQASGFTVTAQIAAEVRQIQAKKVSLQVFSASQTFIFERGYGAPPMFKRGVAE